MANELQAVSVGDADNLYVIIRRQSDNKVWSVADTDWATWADGDIDDYDIALTSQGGDLYTGTFPSGIDAGTRVITVYYIRAGASPAITDTPLLKRDVTWNGSSLSSGSSVALDSDALTSLESAKRLMRISGTTYDTVITELINAMSARFRALTGRTITASDLYEWHDGSLQDALVLRERPVIYFNAVVTGSDNALSVSYSGSAIRAQVAVDSTGVRLITQAAGAAFSRTSVAFSTYPTTSAIATQIAAQGGWSATSLTDLPSKYLHPRAGIDAKIVTVNLTAACDYDDSWRFDERVGVVKRNRCDGFSDTLARPSYGFGRVSTSEPVPAGARNVLVDYRGGYETVPSDISNVVNQMVQAGFQLGAKDNAIQSESLGDYSYTLADSTEFTDRQYTLIAPYISVAVA